MTYWADDSRTHAQGLRRLSPLAREQRRDHVLSRSRVLARTVGRQLLALPEQRVEKAHRRRRARSRHADTPLLVGQALWESRAFAEVRTLPAFRSRNWVLHDRPVRTDRLVIALEGSYRRANMVVAQENLERRSASPRGHAIPTIGCAARPPRRRRPTENRTAPGKRAGPRCASRPARFRGLSRRGGGHSTTASARSAAASCLVLAGAAGVASLVHRIGMPTGVVEILPGDKEHAEPYAAWFCREFGLSYSRGRREPDLTFGRLHASTSPPSYAWLDDVARRRPARRRIERPRDRRLVIPSATDAREPVTNDGETRDTIVSGVRRGARR